MYAVLSVESHRYQAIVVGENLGRCPAGLRGHGPHEMLGMYVVQYELQPGGQVCASRGQDRPPSLNTHDMPTFQGFLQTKDCGRPRELGFFTPAGAAGE